MTTNKLISLLDNPALLATVDINELEQIVSAHPFFATARILLTKKMQQTQHLLLKKEIKRTAVSIPNRKFLYEFLYQKGIRETIIESQAASEVPVAISETILEKTSQQELIKEKETNSSFSKPVEMETAQEPETRFSKPISLKDFGTDKASEMDVLEQQIIGQTIEHVLSLEIEAQHEAYPKKDSNISASNIGTQKFSDWLTILDQDRLKSWRENEEVETEGNQEAESRIIDSFLQKDLNIISPSNEGIEYSPSNLARLSVVDDEDFVTETLAEIYAQQGNLSKALTAYKKLLLKYPEKKTYFAARIEKIEQDLK